MRCRYIYDPIAGKVFIPECWSAIIHGPHACSCNVTGTFIQFEKKEYDKLLSEKNRIIRGQAKELAQCYRIIEKLSKRKIK